MRVMTKTLHRPNRSQRRAATPNMIANLLDELDIRPPGGLEVELVSRWAAKHVWRIDVNGEPWAYVRYLLGSADHFPDRWRHLRLSTLLHEARVGPRVLGITPSSEALGGRAAIVEAALRPITRQELEARAVEALMLFARLHSYIPLHEALTRQINGDDHERLQPLARLFSETRERWFEAVVANWLEAGLSEISDVTELVSELINQIETLDFDDDPGIIVPAHNDPNHGNFMVNRQGALRMIDFEELALNHPVADLGVFLTWYVDRDRHRDLLAHYPLSDPDAMLERMRVWVPLRYIGIAAHWAARLNRSQDQEAWVYASKSVHEWLHGAAEIVFDGAVPSSFTHTLDTVRESLIGRWEK